jgi:AraC family transcriptional activator FtrA
MPVPNRPDTDTPTHPAVIEALRRAHQRGEGAAPLDLVAHRSGLGTTANLRAQMRRRIGLSPSQYRARFAADQL